MTKISSLGRWVPVHNEEWDGDLPLPLTSPKQSREEDTDCGEVVFKKGALPWRAGEYEVRFVVAYYSEVTMPDGGIDPVPPRREVQRRRACWARTDL